MIKPATLWGLMKSCEDSSWLGTICRALGGQDVELDVGQKNMVAVIKLDSGWMDERVEAQRERWRERQKNHRAARGTEQDDPECDNGDLSQNGVTHECHVTSVRPSVPPSVRPESKDSLIESESGRSRSIDVGHPDLKTVVSVATSSMGVPDWYAKWWFENVSASGWVKTNGSPINNSNWRAVLKAWWNRADEKEQARIQNEQKQAAVRTPRSFNEIDWKLCEERCGAFKEGRCTCGCIVPPQFRPRPQPPEECQYFKGV